MGATPDVSAGLADVAGRHGIALLLQFGSTLKGTAHSRSDLDLAALFDGAAPDLDQRTRLVHELQLLYPEREVDLVVLNHADPLLMKQVLQSCRLLTGAPRRLAELKIYAFKRYQDHRRFLAMESAHVRRVLGGA